MSSHDPTDPDVDEPVGPLVHWYGEPFWKVRAVSTAAAFTMGMVMGALTTLAIVRLAARRA